MRPLLKRRAMLQSLGVGIAATATEADAPPPTKLHRERTGMPRYAALNVADPRAAIVTFTRIRGDIAGRRVYTYTRGRVYVVRPGETALPFVGYESGLIDEYRPHESGVYLQTRRELMQFLDLTTGRLAERVANPITGRQDRPINGLVGPLKFAVTPRGIAFNTHDPSQAPGEPLALLWESRPGSTVVTMETLRRYRNSQQPNEWPTASTGEFRTYEDFLSYTVDNRDLRSRRSGLEAQLFYSGQTDLQPWMFVGRSPGHHLWHATGFKTTRFDELPSEFVELTQRLHPGFWDDPFAYRETVRTYEDQLRERLAEHTG